MEKYLIALICILHVARNVQSQDLVRLFQNCHKSAKDFDPCIMNAFNKLAPYFKQGKE